MAPDLWEDIVAAVSETGRRVFRKIETKTKTKKASAQTVVFLKNLADQFSKGTLFVYISSYEKRNIWIFPLQTLKVKYGGTF